MKSSQIILAGFGGQGILFAGKVLAYTSLETERNVTWLPSYGPEMRGGTCNCSIVVSDGKAVGSPVISNPDVLIALNRPSLDKFENAVAPGGFIIYDDSLVDRDVERTDVNVIKIPATELTMEHHLETLANMVILGRMLKATELFTTDEIKIGIEKSVPKSKAWLIEKNIEAVNLGYTYDK
ncbi:MULTISPECIES: 2-oxoacid:acceptor oxidoreductase family protein [Congzhengia]|jgi:2-oxoglutarate ferredoxin oxidoreductase subunit gamma|uniref:2-oxoacid:acceptor oxidoreductase family protein n=1 Tax=Congzhengia minquanensis TaxID=2763657 RepID=A0A926HY87_9FIRM|nr:2-oxoacid:acceptor oxidoreductase family protein [Congzhengia minquanensis]MBC8539541.1 2-oxoacid:acceptor oxidoreductase family protein [Congzhengia minquanensis]